MTDTTEKNPSGFMLQDEVIESITIMTAEELQTVLLAAVAYFKGEEVAEPDGSGIVILTFRMLRKDIDNGLLKYRETCERNGRIARGRYAHIPESTAGDESSPTEPNANTNSDSDTNSISYTNADTRAGARTKARTGRAGPAPREERFTARKKKEQEEEKDNLAWIAHYLDTHRIRTDNDPGRGGDHISSAS